MVIERSRIIAACVKWTLYASIALLCLILREQVFENLKILGVAPLFGGALCAAVAMFEGPIGGGIFGLFCGYLCFGMGGGTENLYALLYLCGGAMCGHLCRNMFRRRLLTTLLWSLMINAAATVLVFVMFYLMPSRATLYSFAVIAPLEIAYSTAVTLLVYPLIRAAKAAVDKQ